MNIALLLTSLPMIAILMCISEANAAPKPLLNRSIVFSWADSVQQKYPDGRVGTATISRSRTAYVSSAGRVFLKSQNSDRGQQLNREVSPGDQAGSLAFKGDIMVSHVVFSGFARQITVRFDPNFSSCNVTVVYGKSGGAATWKSFDQARTFEVQSISAGTPICAIRDGNALAG